MPIAYRIVLGTCCNTGMMEQEVSFELVQADLSKYDGTA